MSLEFFIYARCVFVYTKTFLPTLVGSNNSELIIYYYSKKEKQHTNYEIGKWLSIRLREGKKLLINSYTKADEVSILD